MSSLRDLACRNKMNVLSVPRFFCMVSAVSLICLWCEQANAQLSLKPTLVGGSILGAERAMPLGRQRPWRLGSLYSDAFSCSPSPCLLPPTLASEGGSEVTDTPIATDPRNPRHMIVGGDDFNCPEPSLLGFHVTRDGGSTWNTVCMTSIIHGQHEYYPEIDPSISFNLNGVEYIAGDYGDTEQPGGVVGIESSRDGTNWTPAVVASGAVDRFTAYSFMTVDGNLSSPFANRLYTSTVLIGPPDDNSINQVAVSHSSDGGRTWAVVPVEPKQIYPATDFFTNLAAGQDGAIYVTWLHCVTDCTDDVAYMVFSKSMDGGDTWSMPRALAKIGMPAVWTLPNTKVRVYNYPAIAIDNSNGRFSGSIYVVMYAWTGSYMRVQEVRSTDGGDSWSKPVPVAPPGDAHDQFFPWISVSPTGLVGVSWLDRRNDPANVNYQAFAAISTDGGKTFPSSIRLTKSFSDPNQNGYPQDLWMGDYTGNTWADPNNFIVGWMDSSNGVDMQDVVGGIRLK